jgi:hypothetical protein
MVDFVIDLTGTVIRGMAVDLLDHWIQSVRKPYWLEDHVIQHQVKKRIGKF